MNSRNESAVEQLDQGLSNLDELLKRLRSKIDRLSWLEIDDTVLHDVEHALASATSIRTEITIAIKTARIGSTGWQSREELDSLLTELTDATQRLNDVRARLRDLADELKAGSIQHRLESKRLGLEAMKHRACDELLAESGVKSPCDVAGPAIVGSWLAWALELHGDEAARTISVLRERFAALADFVENMDLAYWRAESRLPSHSAIARSESQDEVPGSQTSDGTGLAPTNQGTSSPMNQGPNGTLGVGDHAADDIDSAARLTASALSPIVREIEAPEGELGSATTISASTSAPDAVKIRVDQETSDEIRQLAIGMAHQGVNVVVEAPQPLALDLGSGPVREERERLDGNGQRSSTSAQEPGSKPPIKSARTSAQSPVHLSVKRLEPELQTFDRYRTSHWISPLTREIEISPAHDPELAAKLASAIARDQGPDNLHRLWLWTKARELLGEASTIPPSDIEAYAAIWGSPLTATSGRDDQRSRQLRLSREAATSHFDGVRLRLMLEALRPSPTEPLLHAEINDLVDGARFKTPELGEAVRKLLTLHARGVQNVIANMRGALGKHVASNEELRRELQKSRQEFHAYVIEQWSACHGQVRQTFCRKAWSKFIESIAPTLGVLYPVEQKGSVSWDIDAIGAIIANFIPMHKRIADDSEIRNKDRTVMDRVAAELAKRADTVNEIQRRLLHTTVNVYQAIELYPVEEIRILQHGPCDDREEESARQLLLRHLDEAEQRQSLLELNGRDLCTHADLLNYFDIDLDALRQPLDQSVVSVSSVKDPVRAAATWLVDGSTNEVVLDESETIFENLRRSLIQRKNEPYPPPLAQLTDGLGSSEQQRLLRLRTEVLETIARTREDLHRLRVRFDEHAAPVPVQELAAIIDAVDHVLNGGQLTEPSLYRAWLKEVLVWANSVAHDVGVLKQDAGHIEDVQIVGRIRETEWRQSAKKKWPHPLEALAHAEEPALVEAWRTGITAKGHQTDRRLRGLFVKAVLPWLEDDAKKQSEAHQILIQTQAFIDRFASEGLNPCYLPQVAKFQNVVILTPSVPPHSPHFLARLSESIAGRQADLSIILTPKLQPNVRDQAINLLRTRTSSAAMIDDIDLCRLLNPGDSRPEPTTGLFEIAFEQLDPKLVSPFRSQRIEMFVGRRTQAEQIFHGRVSRLFSGRKLGKSSLLRFLHDSYDKTRLPSGNELRVVYVNIPGRWEEGVVVDDILLAIRDELAHQRVFPLLSESPGAYLERALKAFVQHREESLLIILDEADQFVASQIEKYDQPDIREACLSFRMSRAIEEFAQDSRGLPRIRFLFSGYRTTNTVQGVWNNWGEVMRLRPLDPHEAAALIAGPLARLGIDALEQSAAIAYRCGCQPAVLLRFGQALFEHVARSGTTRVTAEDVVKVFQQPDVEDEIRTVVEGNFQGNKLGEVIFHALLLEFGQRPPGYALDDAEVVVLQQLAAIEPDLSWIERGSTSAQDAVERQLRDLTDRHLLVFERNAERARYRLRFPHHLMLLRHVEPEQAIQELGRRVRALQQGSGDSGSQVRSLLRGNMLFDVHQLVRTSDADYPLRAIVMPSIWGNALADPTGGIAAALGISDGNVVTPDRAIEMLTRIPLIVRDCNPATATAVVRGRSDQPAALLLGGVDLLRWALRELSGKHLIELRTLGRMNQSTLWWWFARVRCLEFNNSDAFEHIWKKTSGVPCLVKIIDEILVPNTAAVASTVTAGEFRQVLDDFDAQLSVNARALTEGPIGIRLEPRELDILRMIAGASEEARPDERMIEHLTDLWELHLERDPRLPREPLGPEDSASISVLIGTGMVPTNSRTSSSSPAEQLRALDAEDAVYNLLRFI